MIATICTHKKLPLQASSRTTSNHLESSMRTRCHHLYNFMKMGIRAYEREMKERKSKSSVGKGERKRKGDKV